ncbi:MAG: alpha-beta hydrolase superfamily lysophospholipase [Parvicella sp.]|jgi:alpha-beta hydrolase superfamily lysophospholipase
MYWILILGFILVNIVAIFHAYKFTHFATNNTAKTESPENLNMYSKIKTLLFGIDNARPTNEKMPLKYAKIELQSNKKIECWYLKKGSSTDHISVKGTVILFHGYSVGKSTLLERANEFEKLGYNLLLVDFMGSGGSEGIQTTLGFKEAKQVKTAYEFLVKEEVEDIYLFGTSMGAVAIMKAIADFDLKPRGVIVECPFGSMYRTTCARFKTMNIPPFPMAGLLVFWGGLQNKFWPFGHSPTEYAKKISIPTLILYGEQDQTVSRSEIDGIYKNLKGIKKLATYPLVGHEDYLITYKAEWSRDIIAFIAENE